jgi:hypothetical protein
MSDNGIQYFALLKKEIVILLQQSVPSVPPLIENWKGQDIVYFQDDLMSKIKGTISEKWFYTHLKLEGDKLPRIDMLNMLSRYVGYTDWNDFKEKKKQEVPNIIEKSDLPKPNKKKLKLLALALTICLIIVILFYIFRPRTYTFCFYDASQQMLLADQNIDIIVLNEGESPIYKRCEKGCFSIKSNYSKLRFIVKTPYYNTDTIVRILGNSDHEEIIRLHANDYAMMIHFFSKSKIDDWQKRRKQLNAMFTDNAQIYQMYENEELGMELYNKTEFINKLTMPLQSLQNIEVIETVYSGNRISILKFRQKQTP